MGEKGMRTGLMRVSKKNRGEDHHFLRTLANYQLRARVLRRCQNDLRVDHIPTRILAVDV